MEKPFEIRFDFLVANSSLKVSLRATAELHHSDPYYVVQDFYFEESGDGIDYPSVLPPQEIKMIKRDSRRLWVHRDSEQESLLSTKIGEAIEAKLRSGHL